MSAHLFAESRFFIERRKKKAGLVNQGATMVMEDE